MQTVNALAVEEYEVAVFAMVVVKRLVRVRATSAENARYIAKDRVGLDCQAGIDHEWSIPQKHRDEVDSDQCLLGPMVRVHHASIHSPVLTGMCPTKVT